MKPIRRVTLRLALIALAGIPTAFAQPAPAWPQKPITLLVGYPAGGSTDLMARNLAPELSSRLGQPVVIENLPGAGGSIAAQKTASAAADGYTLLVGANNEVSINALVRKSVKYNGLRDFTPLGVIGTQPLLLAASTASGIKSTDELLKAAKSKPGALNYGSSGVGTSLHVAGEMVKQQGGVFITHIPYRGTGPLFNDIAGGNLSLGLFVLSSALPHLKSGKIVPLGTTEAKRSGFTPDIPALAEHPALKNVDIGVWFMLLGPANLPEAVTSRIKAALNESLKAPELLKKMQAGSTLVPTTQPDLTKFLTSETSKYRRIVDEAKITDE